MSFIVAVVRYTRSAEDGKTEGAGAGAAQDGAAARTASAKQAAGAWNELANDIGDLGRAGLRACALDGYDKIVWHIQLGEHL